MRAHSPCLGSSHTAARAFTLAPARLPSPGARMKNACVPLAWFVIVGAMLAAASGLSLVLV
ncbi:hypothetical protein PFWH6_3453 [Pseudomonas fluorescens WH6]|nr:hypothetical protein PFWH6_3453 [Pseudomonas fluorescens WH6]